MHGRYVGVSEAATYNLGQADVYASIDLNRERSSAALLSAVTTTPTASVLGNGYSVSGPGGDGSTSSGATHSSSECSCGADGNDATPLGVPHNIPSIPPLNFSKISKS